MDGVGGGANLGLAAALDEIDADQGYGGTPCSCRATAARPAISRQIRSPERELGEALFERDSRRVRLTAAGEALVPPARAVAGVVAAAKDEFAARSGLLTGTLSLGAADGVESSSLPVLLGTFHLLSWGQDLDAAGVHAYFVYFAYSAYREGRA